MRFATEIHYKPKKKKKKNRRKFDERLARLLSVKWVNLLNPLSVSPTKCGLTILWGWRLKG